MEETGTAGCGTGPGARGGRRGRGHEAWGGGGGDHPQEPQPVTLAANVLTAVLGDLCAKTRLAQNLVANSNDVKALVRAKFADGPLPEDSQLTVGWRREHLLPELLALLEGRRVLRIAH